MTLMPASKQEIVTKLASELDEALGLLREFQEVANNENLEPQPTAPMALLDQCLALCADHGAAQPEPIRTIHHFACTGGTLISKCIASMPNIQLLSEVDPFSTPVGAPTKPQFAPTNMVALMQQSTRGTSQDLIADMFLNNLEVIHRHTMDSGLRLVLRDHAHSHFCRDGAVQDHPDLRTLVARRFTVLSLVTVRDPVDSYLSLKANGWIHFNPSTFDEYCRRYLDFIQVYEGVPIVRFEDFVSDPENEMKKICDWLGLSFNVDFIDLFSVHRLTGDSGRKSDSIGPRHRRDAYDDIRNEIDNAANYCEICRILGYSTQ